MHVCNTLFTSNSYKLPNTKYYENRPHSRFVRPHALNQEDSLNLPSSSNETNTGITIRINEKIEAIFAGNNLAAIGRNFFIGCSRSDFASITSLKI